MTIEDLKRCRDIPREIASLRRRIADLRNSASWSPVASGAGDGAHGGGQGDRMAAYMAQVDALTDRLSSRIIELEQLRQSVDAWADALPAQQGQIVRLRFVEGQSWQRISRSTHYAERHARRILAAAIGRLSQDVR